MKRVKNLIKLTHLNSERLNEKELGIEVGGKGNCICMCYYETCGGSSTSDNEAKNNERDLTSMLPKNVAMWA